MSNRFGALLIGWLVLPTISGCYVLNQGYHQGKLLLARVPLDDALKEKDLDDKKRDKLAFISELLAYAEAEGLKTKGGYSSYVDLKRDHLSYLVAAAHPDQLKAVTWYFPIVGRVPYLGFFNQEDRDAEAKNLRDQGYDLEAYEVDAFSSLGWFSDPVYSSMLSRSKASLSDTIFHELTHLNFWEKNEADFNENIASFVGYHLTIKFFQAKGANADLERYLAAKKDKALFGEWLKELKAALKELYEQRKSLERSALLTKKAEIFRVFLQEKRPAFKVADYVGKDPWNNATVLGASLYQPDLERFQKAFDCFGKTNIPLVGTFLSALEEKLKKQSGAFLALDSFCEP